MRKQGPVVIVDDDSDDQQFYQNAFAELGYKNELVCFSTGAEALAYLYRADVVPFVVISDINMPGMDGFELRDHVLRDKGVSEKCIPYIFLTTSSRSDEVTTAYKKSAQGFFIKPSNMMEIKAILDRVMKYWQECVAPPFRSMN
jgi:CheY-like chemotaxis protein